MLGKFQLDLGNIRTEVRSLQEFIAGSVNCLLAASNDAKFLLTSCLLSSTQISACDNILAGMEEMLGKFQLDLGNISTEIRSLQEQSQSMSVRLRNRKATEQRLGGFIENVAIPASLIDGIMQSEARLLGKLWCFFLLPVQ